MDEHVTVSMPYYGCPVELPRAVRSVLAQTHRALRLVVTDDGDPYHPAARVLAEAGIADERLTVFRLHRNRGRYYADAVALAACSTPWWVVHDADDWSEPEWIEGLLSRAVKGDVGAVFGVQRVYGMHGQVRLEVPKGMVGPLPLVMRHLAHHAGLYRTEVIREAGGYHPGYRIGYDTLAVNLVRMCAPVGTVDGARYHRVARRGSLTTNSSTRWGSPARRAAAARLAELYRRALSSQNPGGTVRADIPPPLVEDVAADATRLAAVLP